MRRRSHAKVPQAEQGPAVLEVPGVGGIPSAHRAFRAGQALYAVHCPVAPEGLKPVPPHVQEIVRANVPLHQLRPVLNIQASADIPIAAHAGSEDPRTAQEICSGFTMGSRCGLSSRT